YLFFRVGCLAKPGSGTDLFLDTLWPSQPLFICHLWFITDAFAAKQARTGRSELPKRVDLIT
ncbi:MAG TPA: hypothetical protein DDW24_07675, partial [Blastocatellia bacterium]|nr:hypothetical protein [Blastocatellia bacterium]